MKFEWDDNKNQQNLLKHGLDFLGAALVFLDPKRIEYVDDRLNYGEVRYCTIGMVNGIIIYVVYTLRQQCYRLISARRANKNERKAYLHYK